MIRLTDYFERVTVISLAKRTDRRERLHGHLEEVGLAGVDWTAALPGKATPSPPGWSGGSGAWGCLQSHLKVFRKATSDRVESLLILEDDVVFSSHTARCLPHLMRAVPVDWGQFYMGGQYISPPRRTGHPLIWRATNINRTHACAYRGRVLPDVIEHLTRWDDYAVPAGKSGWHLDHQLGRAHEHELWPCYAGSWWLAGQEADISDICGQTLRQRWWHPRRYALLLPFLHLPHTPDSAHDVRFLTETEDARFLDAISSDGHLLAWLHSHAERALDFGCLPAWRSRRLSLDRVAALWPAGVRDAGAPDICDYPFNGLFNHSMATALRAEIQFPALIHKN